MHLRDVETLGDLGLRDGFVEAQVDDHALASGQHLERALEVGAVFEQLEPRVGDADRVGERLRFLVGLAGDFAVERKQIVGLPELLRFEDLFFAGFEVPASSATVGLRPSSIASFSLARLTARLSSCSRRGTLTAQPLSRK